MIDKTYGNIALKQAALRKKEQEEIKAGKDPKESQAVRRFALHAYYYDAMQKD